MDSERFADDVVVVTGSTRGIGEGIAREFLEGGAAVVLNDSGRDPDRGPALAAELDASGHRVEYVSANMRSPAEIEALMETAEEAFGGIDVLVNNAAVWTNTTALETELSDWSRVVETAFRGYWLCAKHAVERMDEGAIVNVSSNHAIATTPGMFPYNAVKAGILSMTRALALELGPRIRVNCVTPGWVRVGHVEDGLSESDIADLEAKHPVGRLGSPADVAHAVSFLADDRAGFVTGASLTIDGGRTAVLQDDYLPEYTNETD